jgi:ribosome-associated heat shock protein Hsp15
VSIAPATVRIDKWLWASRFFKTRALAATAVEAGRVTVNGDRCKPSKLVRANDALVIRRPPIEHAVIVRAVSDKRGAAPIAQQLYEETAESRARREAIVAELKSAPPPVFKGRPTKRERRDLERFMRKQHED